MIKIFYKDKIIFLSKKVLSDFYGDKFFFSSNYAPQLNNFLINKNSENINIYGAEENEILNSFSAKIFYIKAAGGIIFNQNNEILIIKRLGYFDFPKGKSEKNENTEKTVQREISEECGIKSSDINLLSFIKTTYHIYSENNKTILKETFWYKVFFDKNYELKPQLEENIKEILWIKEKDIKNYINNQKSYPSLVDLIEDIN